MGWIKVEGEKYYIDVKNKKIRTPSQMKYHSAMNNICECGIVIKQYSNFRRHLESKKHKKYIEHKKKFDNTTFKIEFDFD